MEPAIKMAEQKLDVLSSDPLTVELYKAREYAAHEKANLISTGIERGKTQGRAEGRIEGLAEGLAEGALQKSQEIATQLLDILDDKTISIKTGLPLEEVAYLRQLHNK